MNSNVAQTLTDLEITDIARRQSSDAKDILFNMKDILM